MTDAADGRLRVSYELTPDCGDPHEIARGIALEQTVELPARCLTPEVAEQVVGSIERVEPLDDGRSRARIDYDPRVVGDDAAQLVTLLFGNISLKRGIRVAAIDWPASVLERFGGPRFGVDGLRALCGAGARPLLCAALKPMGSSVDELATLAARFASSGADLIKDDHGLADQTWAPFAERVVRCQEAIERVNAMRGTRATYVPSLSGGGRGLDEQLEIVRRAGCRGVMLQPWIAGLDALRRVAADADLAVLAHPALAGALLGDTHGIAAELALGQLMRVLGADASIYPNVGGRFPLDESCCVAINRALREPLGDLAPSMPMPGGGIDAARAPHWIERYGRDTALLIGGSLYASDDLERAVEAVARAIRDAG